MRCGGFGSCGGFVGLIECGVMWCFCERCVGCCGGL